MKLGSKTIDRLWKVFPPKIKEMILQRIVLSITTAHIKKWEQQTLYPLHQKLVRLEMEVEKLKKNKK